MPAVKKSAAGEVVIPNELRLSFSLIFVTSNNPNTKKQIPAGTSYSACESWTSGPGGTSNSLMVDVGPFTMICCLEEYGIGQASWK